MGYQGSVNSWVSRCNTQKTDLNRSLKTFLIPVKKSVNETAPAQVNSLN